MSDRKQEIVDALTSLEARLERWPNKEAWEQDFKAALKKGEDTAFELLRFSGVSEREARIMANPEHRLYESCHNAHSDLVGFAQSRKAGILQEAQGHAVYRLSVYDGFDRCDAQEVIDELGPTWTIDEIATVFATGMTDKMRADAINLLTERGAPRRTKIADACSKVIHYLHVFRGYDHAETSKAVRELSQEWTENEIERINRFNTRLDSMDKQVMQDIETVLTERGALKKMMAI